MTSSQLLPLIAPLVALAVFALRARRPRAVKLERLWIAPAVICALAGAAIAFSPHEGRFTLVNVILFAAALGVGGLIGWLRAKGVKLTVEPMTHQVTSAVSPLGLVLLVAVFVVRYALRFATQSEARQSL